MTLDKLLGSGKTFTVDVDASVLHCFFDDKVDKVHAFVADAYPLTFSSDLSIVCCMFCVGHMQVHLTADR